MSSPSQDSTVTAPITGGELLKGRIHELKEALQKQLPGYESILHTIHRELARDPATVHLLDEQDIGIIVAGLQKRTGIFIANAEAEKVAKGKKKVSINDL